MKFKCYCNGWSDGLPTPANLRPVFITSEQVLHGILKSWGRQRFTHFVSLMKKLGKLFYNGIAGSDNLCLNKEVI